jgi:CubicO group peptidase (beta-lactamase class C family)
MHSTGWGAIIGRSRGEAMSEQLVVEGDTATGFEGVRDAFVANFAQGLEVGAAFSAYHRGAKVVDLWGGTADVHTGRPWTEDTIVLVYSTTKGMTAVCANKLAQEGALDVDAPVSKYWPEFAAAGKENVPVSYLLSHQVGLPYIDGSMSLEDALAWDPVVDALAHHAPTWEPGSQHGYHATTYGWLVGEVIRRVTGRSIGAYFREVVAEPLGLSSWIGLPESEEPRVARLIGWGNDGDDGLLGGSELDEATRATLAPLIGPESVLGRTLTAPGGALSGGVWNQRAVRAAEIPAANGVSDARSIARMYAACIGEVDGVRLLTDEQVKRATTQQTSGPNVVLMNLDIQFGLGFMLPSTIMTIGGPNGFGHFGAGGSMGWADPDAELAFGYVMNRMQIGLAGDTRTTSLLDACYAAVQ